MQSGKPRVMQALWPRRVPARSLHVVAGARAWSLQRLQCHAPVCCPSRSPTTKHTSPARRSAPSSCPRADRTMPDVFPRRWPDTCDCGPNDIVPSARFLALTESLANIIGVLKEAGEAGRGGRPAPRPDHLTLPSNPPLGRAPRGDAPRSAITPGRRRISRWHSRVGAAFRISATRQRPVPRHDRCTTGARWAVLVARMSGLCFPERRLLPG
jgi:hypothetical protein